MFYIPKKNVYQYTNSSYIRMVIFFPKMFFNIYVVFNTIKGHNKVGREEHFISGSVPSTWPPGKHPNMFF